MLSATDTLPQTWVPLCANDGSHPRRTLYALRYLFDDVWSYVPEFTSDLGELLDKFPLLSVRGADEAAIWRYNSDCSDEILYWWAERQWVRAS